MKKILLTIILLLTTQQSLANNPQLTTKINQTLKSFNSPISIGILIKDQKTGQVLYQKNADHYFMPASNEKLLTAYAALLTLGENYKYQTQIYFDKTKIINGTLNGNVYLQFSGDPEFTVPQLYSLINTLYLLGVKHINGAFIIDDTAFDQMTMSPGTTWDDKDYCWGAPVSAVIIDKNCVTATIVPAAKPAMPASMVLPEFPQSQAYINNVITQTASTEKCFPKITRSGDTAYTINGCIHAIPTKPIIVSNAVGDPRENLKFLVNYFLNIYHITNVHYEFKKIPMPLPAIGSEESPPVSTLIKTMLKESDNLIANTLFKTMGMVSSKDAGTFQNGSGAVRNTLRKSIKLDIPETTMIDGAGGSRYDFLTPQQLVSLLQQAALSPQSAVFISALPIGGVDGTLKDRMKDASTLGKVFAKTGSETAVNTLSGYLVTNKKHSLIFSIMINGFVDMPGKYQDLEDKLCAIMIENA